MSVGPIEGGQDVDLNLAPIIDAFTVLIAFMLISASFLAIGVIDAGVAAAGKPAANAKPPAVRLIVHLKADQTLQVKAEGKETRTVTLKPEAGAWNDGGMSRELDAMKKKWPDVKALTISADDTVAYQDVIARMNAARSIYPAVLLGGF